MPEFDLQKAVCPLCGGKFEAGFLIVHGSHKDPACLRWTNGEKKKRFFGLFSSLITEAFGERDVKWYQIVNTKETTQIKAVRCKKCKIGIFSYGDNKPPEAENAEM